MSPQVRCPGSPTLKSRSTRSGSGGAETSGMVVRHLLASGVFRVEAVLAHDSLDALVVDAASRASSLVSRGDP